MDTIAIEDGQIAWMNKVTSGIEMFNSQLQEVSCTAETMLIYPISPFKNRRKAAGINDRLSLYTVIVRIALESIDRIRHHDSRSTGEYPV